MILLLPLAAHAQGTCLTPQVLDALAGRAPAPHPHALLAPAGVGQRPLQSPPAGRQIYGTPYDNHLETAHFTINWWSEGVTREMAESAGAALETAWASFEAEGWTLPVSSDDYYLWVLLDPSLGGTTGYTTEYFTDDYPDGYPLIWLNPDWAGYSEFWAALASHELMHAFQYAVRDYSGAGEVETWYWEASATWGSELADPSVDGHQYTSDWYATTADRSYSSTENSRQYGLFAFNAWLDREGIGPATMRETWQLSAERAGEPWDSILSQATGVEATELWARFTGAYANGGLEESALYSAYPSQGTLIDGIGGTLPYLGSHAWVAPQAGAWRVEGEALLATNSDWGEAVEVQAGDHLAVIGIGASDSPYRLLLDEQGDSGTPTDDGGSDSPAVEVPLACGCGATPTGAGLLLPFLILLRRRR